MRFVVNNRKNRNKILQEQGLWKSLCDLTKHIDGLGPVYMITLLHFITQGEFPIYDRFAMASLSSLRMGECGVFVPVNLILIYPAGKTGL